jgi:hypothetical protein
LEFAVPNPISRIAPVPLFSFDDEPAQLGRLPIYGFAARSSFVCDGGEPPDDPEKLAAMGRNAITALLQHSCYREEPQDAS